ncbi:hypothetical protein ACHQM5_019839 [Ranunculus cassubicifolius]
MPLRKYIIHFYICFCQFIGQMAFARPLGEAVLKAASTWFNPHMAAASHAILERIPLVDVIVEVRDARAPISSKYQHTRNLPSSRRIIVLNKTDLANRLQTQEWLGHFLDRNCLCYGMNSHNKDNIKEFLKFLQAQVRDLNYNKSKFTTTIMLVGIPNVGKSALAKSLHQIGRVSAAEKGKLKHATVSPLPGETKDITSLKIASHPNIYVLDSPGVLHPDNLDVEMGSKLALTGAIKDGIVKEIALARYFLAILNLSNEHNRWEALMSKDEDDFSREYKANFRDTSGANTKRQKICYSDHTQDVVVRDVRRRLYETISCFKGNLEDDSEMGKLIDSQLVALQAAFRLESGENVCEKVAVKLLNLYRTGRLGHYTFDKVPRNHS